MSYIARLSIFLTIIFFNQKITSQSIENNSTQIETEVIDSIFSNVLNESREFWVRLPENYNPNNDVKYPVVYLLDGFSLKSNLETVYDNYRGHYLPDMILVGISNRTNRTRDLTISQVKNRRGNAINVDTARLQAEHHLEFAECWAQRACRERLCLEDFRYSL